jgi:hypothetical protein
MRHDANAYNQIGASRPVDKETSASSLVLLTAHLCEAFAGSGR